jgi:lipid-binding SYLF domain-containing protein
MRCKNGYTTYMRMISGGVGIGLGVKDFRGVFVFATDDKFKQFINSGWEANAQADAAAKAGDKGGAFTGAITVAPGVTLYQLTKNGLALQATIHGTKYYKNDELNGK